jgi:hypothetical protein
MDKKIILNHLEVLDTLGKKFENVSEITKIAGKLIQNERKTNIEGLKLLSKQINVDVTSPVVELFGIMKLTIQTINLLTVQDENTKTSRNLANDFLEAFVMNVLKKMLYKN